MGMAGGSGGARGRLAGSAEECRVGRPGYERWAGEWGFRGDLSQPQVCFAPQTTCTEPWGLRFPHRDTRTSGPEMVGSRAAEGNLGLRSEESARVSGLPDLCLPGLVIAAGHRLRRAEKLRSKPGGRGTRRAEGLLTAAGETVPAREARQPCYCLAPHLHFCHSQEHFRFLFCGAAHGSPDAGGWGERETSVFQADSCSLRERCLSFPTFSALWMTWLLLLLRREDLF